MKALEGFLNQEKAVIGDCEIFANLPLKLYYLLAGHKIVRILAGVGGVYYWWISVSKVPAGVEGVQ